MTARIDQVDLLVREEIVKAPVGRCPGTASARRASIR